MDINNITSIKSPIINRKTVHTPFNPVLSMLLAETSPEIFPKHKEYFFLFQSLLL